MGAKLNERVSMPCYHAANGSHKAKHHTHTSGCMYGVPAWYNLPPHRAHTYVSKTIRKSQGLYNIYEVTVRLERNHWLTKYSEVRE